MKKKCVQIFNDKKKGIPRKSTGTVVDNVDPKVSGV